MNLKPAFFLLALAFLSAPLFARDVTFFIAPNGNDSAAGSMEAPFATLYQAVSAVKKECAVGDVECAAIYFRAGRYESQAGRYFAKLDFNALKAPLLISSWNDEPVTLLGGVSLKGWTREPDQIAGKTVWSVPVPEFIKDPTQMRTLFLNDSIQTWARWPNFEPDHPYSGGWAYVAGEPFNMYTEVEGEPLDKIVMKEKKAEWKHPERGFVLIFARHNWGNNLNPIKEYDPETRTLTTVGNLRFAARPADRYCVFGMAEELDAEGEWVCDVENRRVRFIPPKGTTPEQLENAVSIGNGESAIFLESCANIKFHGLNICCSSHSAFRAIQCSDLTVEKCHIHDTGFQKGGWGEGAGVDSYKCDRLTVYGCDIHHTGAAGVSLAGGEVYTLRESGNVAENNYVHHPGLFFRGGGAFSVSGCGNRVAHNLGHDFPRGPISVTGVKNLIEFNHFHHANMESEDTGLIYMNGGGTWINSRISTIRYNHFADNIGFGHDVSGKYHFFMFSWGIYLDDTSADVKVYGNLVERCTIGCFHLHNARENDFYNNIFVDGGKQQAQLSGWTNDPNARMMKRHIEDMTRNWERAVQCPEWRTQRDMRVPPKETFLPDGTSMRGNLFERNIFYYPNQPESNYVRYNAVNFGFNQFDRNLIWNGSPDREPETGMPPEAGKTLSENLLTPEITVKSWSFFQPIFPEERMRKEVSEDGTILLGCGFNPEKPYVKYASLKSDPFPLEPGKTYRIRCKIRLTDVDGDAELRVVCDRKGLWRSFHGASCSLVQARNHAGEFVDCSGTFAIPPVGDPKFDERMTEFNLTFSAGATKGTAEVRDVVLEEVESLSSWETWKLHGQDQHSVLADPLFVDPAKGDYHLKPESPALKLGFEPLPLEKMGPYADPRRWSWPIEEADGVKNHPEWLEIE